MLKFEYISSVWKKNRKDKVTIESRIQIWYTVLKPVNWSENCTTKNYKQFFFVIRRKTTNNSKTKGGNEGREREIYAIRTQAPPASLIFFSASCEKYLAFTIMGVFGTSPLPNTCKRRIINEQLNFLKMPHGRDSRHLRPHPTLSTYSTFLFSLPTFYS